TSADDRSTLAIENCPTVPITNIAVVVMAGPSANATAITVTTLRQSSRGRSASAQGMPTPRNIQSRAGSSRKGGRSQSGKLITGRDSSVEDEKCPVLDRTFNRAYYRRVSIVTFFTS